MTLIGTNVIKILKKWWRFIDKDGRKEFQNSPLLSTLSLNKITMPHLEKIPLERATLVDRWRLSALGYYTFTPVESLLPGPLHCEVCQKVIDKPISRRKHI